MTLKGSSELIREMQKAVAGAVCVGANFLSPTRARIPGLLRTIYMKTIRLVLAVLLFLGAAIARAEEVVILEGAASGVLIRGPRRRMVASKCLSAISRDTGVPISTLGLRNVTRLVSAMAGCSSRIPWPPRRGKRLTRSLALKASGHGWELDREAKQREARANHQQRAPHSDAGQRVKKRRKSKRRRRITTLLRMSIA